jgi:flagellar protein FliO/FliZ
VEEVKPAAREVSDPASLSNLLQVTVGLVVVLVAIFGAAWLLRRTGHFQSSGSGAMKIVAGISMGPRERVVLMQVGEEQLLLGVAPGRIEKLHVLDKPLDLGKDDSSQSHGTFAQRFQVALQQRIKS